MAVPVTPPDFAFGLYEVHSQAGELWKAGYRVKLQSQPFSVLIALLERAGDIVTRDELQLRVWGPHTTVDFDHSLGIAINKVRDALGDSAGNPIFIETLARRGYRFIAPVRRPEPHLEILVPELLTPQSEEIQPGTSFPVPVATLEAGSAVQSPPSATREAGSLPRWSAWALLSLSMLFAALVGYLGGRSRRSTAPPHLVRVTQSGHLAPSVVSMEALSASASDGVHMFTTVIQNGRRTLAAISLVGGAVVPLDIPTEVASPVLGSISPDGSRLLLREHLSPESEQPLWVVPALGGSAQRVGSAMAHDATWMPDGVGILYANGNQLYLTGLNGNNPQPYASLPGRAFWLRWNPAGKLLRFTIIDPISHTLSLWQLSADQRKPARLLSGFNTPSTECCGVWTRDGTFYVFQSSRGGGTDLWRLRSDDVTGPVRLTDGPLQFESPLAAGSGARVYFLGIDARSELERYVPGAGLVPERGFLASAVRVNYSRDGKSVAWTDDAGKLWRARSDGTEQLQLTPDNLDVFLARWSPDGTHLALMAREPGKVWRIYTVGADGADLKSLLDTARNAADPSWSPDGQKLVFGRVNDIMGSEDQLRTLETIDLRTGVIAPVPGSDNLFSPRWSPDGRYIAALSLDQRSVHLLDVPTHTWSTLSVPSGADPVWSADSHSLFLHASLDPDQPIDRIHIPEGRVEEVVRLANLPGEGAVDYVLGGLSADGNPLIRARIFTGNVYWLDLKANL